MSLLRRRCRAAMLALMTIPLGIALAQEPQPTAPSAAAAPAAAAPAAASPAPSFEELQAMIARMQQRIENLGSVSAERDQALRFLEQQVEKAAGEIGGSDQTNAALRGETAALSNQLQDVARDRDRLTSEAGERSATVGELQEQLATLSGELAGTRSTLQAARAREAELTARIAALQQGVDQADRTAAERIAKAEAEAAARNADVERLRKERDTLRQQLDTAHNLVASTETRLDQQQETIETLDAQLAQALARRVEELEQYRSEFFGRLRQALGERPDLRIVGDRFVFQSEVLFDSGSAKLDPEGERQLAKLAQTLKEVAAKIPENVRWVLRVDGHTDKAPIRNAPYASNWQLSSARAISVVEFLIRQGVPPNRLAAVGFGEHQPLEPHDDEIAYRRNRRIEFKLTES